MDICIKSCEINVKVLTIRTVDSVTLQAKMVRTEGPWLIVSMQDGSARVYSQDRIVEVVIKQT